MYITTPLVDAIVSIPSGGLDQGTTWWKPNKGMSTCSDSNVYVCVWEGGVAGRERDTAHLVEFLFFLSIFFFFSFGLTLSPEQYIETKSHWLPSFPLATKHGVVERHRRGAAGDGQEYPVLPPS